MRRLYEWKVMNPSASGTNATSTTATNSSTTIDYKDKLKKLFDYHMLRIGHRLDSYKIKHLDEDQQFVNLEYEETHTISNSKVTKEIVITYEKTTGSWVFELIVNGKLTTRSGKSFNDLIDAIRPYVAGPLKGSAEDQEILEELSIYKEFKEYENLWSDEQ